MADRAAPLADLEGMISDAAFAGATLRTVPFLAQVGIRLDPTGPAASRVAAALGLELPEANRVAESGGRRALWLGPDEWLVVAADGEERALVAILEEAIGADGAVVDLSANRTGLDLSGPQATEVLATCMALDVHPRAFGAGRCAQTLLQKAPVIVERRGDDAFLLLVRPSFAAYAAEWLVDGMAGLAADLAAV
jgi:sarcosine oxidase subunit gamma